MTAQERVRFGQLQNRTVALQYEGQLVIGEHHGYVEGRAKMYVGFTADRHLKAKNGFVEMDLDSIGDGFVDQGCANSHQLVA